MWEDAPHRVPSERCKAEPPRGTTAHLSEWRDSEADASECGLAYYLKFEAAKKNSLKIHNQQKSTCETEMDEYGEALKSTAFLVAS